MKKFLEGFEEFEGIFQKFGFFTTFSFSTIGKEDGKTFHLKINQQKD